MTNLNLQNQYLPQGSPFLQNGNNAYSPNMQGLSPAMQGLDYDSVNIQDNAVSQAVRNYSVMEHPGVLLKNLLCSFLVSVGFTGATNWLMSSKKIAEGVTNASDFTNTRLHRAGEYLDKSWAGRTVDKVTAAVKNGASKIPVPKFLTEIFEKMKMGGIAVWDKQGMYSIGKPAEALNEAVEYLSKVDKNKLAQLFENNPKVQKEILDCLDKYSHGKIRGPVVYQKIASYFDDIPADKLAKLNPTGTVGRWMGVKHDINHVLHKAKFFAGNHSQKALAKGLQKTTALAGEAYGGGVLGGKAALIMNTLGMLTAFNSASEAEDGEKLKTFMEDYIGLTLGSYIMSFFVSTWFNKFLGVSELGMDKAKFAEVAKKLGIDASTGRIQDGVIAHNREFSKWRKLNEIADNLRNGKIDESKALSKIGKLNIQVPNDCKSRSSILGLIEKEIGGRDAKFFEAVRADLKEAMKSKLTFKSIFKETAENSGGFFKRLTRYVVQKPLSLLGRVLSVGRYDMISGTKGSLKSILKAIKRGGGGIARIGLVMFVLIEPFKNAFVKMSHAIFGKPKNSILDKPEDKQAQETQIPQTSPSVMNVPLTDTNILNNMLNKPGAKAENPVSNTQPSQTVVQPASPVPAKPLAAEPIKGNSDAIVNPDKAPELKRTYIPSPTPAKVAVQKDPREGEVELAILKAEMAERAAREFLSKGV